MTPTPAAAPDTSLSANERHFIRITDHRQATRVLDALEALEAEHRQVLAALEVAQQRITELLTENVRLELELQTILTHGVAVPGVRDYP